MPRMTRGKHKRMMEDPEFAAAERKRQEEEHALPRMISGRFYYCAIVYSDRLKCKKCSALIPKGQMMLGQSGQKTITRYYGDPGSKWSKSVPYTRWMHVDCMRITKNMKETMRSDGSDWDGFEKLTDADKKRLLALLDDEEHAESSCSAAKRKQPVQTSVQSKRKKPSHDDLRSWKVLYELDQLDTKTVSQLSTFLREQDVPVTGRIRKAQLVRLAKDYLSNQAT